jgi:MarR family transcriptional regulator, organic hydroperoxide resistance regulator
MAAHKEPSPAGEAWGMIAGLFFSARPRFFQLAQEFDLAPMQLRALKELQPDGEVPMSTLASVLFCDASNVTGIVDRLEARGLIERRPSAADRRVKMLRVTPEGARVRERLVERMSEPPPSIAALSHEDQVALRDLLRKATAAASEAEVPVPAGG